MALVLTAQECRESAQQARKDAERNRKEMDRLLDAALAYDNQAIDMEDAITKLEEVEP